jgi:hypothetical protein
MAAQPSHGVGKIWTDAIQVCEGTFFAADLKAGDLEAGLAGLKAWLGWRHADGNFDVLKNPMVAPSFLADFLGR